MKLDGLREASSRRRGLDPVNSEQVALTTVHLGSSLVTS